MLENKRLLSGLACLKEEILDKKTGRPCTVCKAWNFIVQNYTGNNMYELLYTVEERFTLEDHHIIIISNLMNALEIMCK